MIFGTGRKTILAMGIHPWFLLGVIILKDGSQGISFCWPWLHKLYMEKDNFICASCRGYKKFKTITHQSNYTASKFILIYTPSVYNLACISLLIRVSRHTETKNHISLSVGNDLKKFPHYYFPLTWCFL